MSSGLFPLIPSAAPSTWPCLDRMAFTKVLYPSLRILAFENLTFPLLLLLMLYLHDGLFLKQFLQTLWSSSCIRWCLFGWHFDINDEGGLPSAPAAAVRILMSVTLQKCSNQPIIHYGLICIHPNISPYFALWWRKIHVFYAVSSALMLMVCLQS